MQHLASGKREYQKSFDAKYFFKAYCHGHFSQCAWKIEKWRKILESNDFLLAYRT